MKSSYVEQDIEKAIEIKENEIMGMVKTEMTLFKLDLGLGCNKKKIDKATAAVRDYRESKWQKALKMAGGDFKKAEIIYGDINF